MDKWEGLEQKRMEFVRNSILRKDPIKIFPNFYFLLVTKQNSDHDSIVLKISFVFLNMLKLTSDYGKSGFGMRIKIPLKQQL